MPTNNFTEDQIKEAAKNSKSVAEMCRQLGLIPAGGNYASMKRRIARYDIDISHFTGQGWRKDDFSDTPNTKIGFKKKLIRERGHQCERCKNSTWFELPITLELEHIDGDNSNNVEENLLLLCPNCHSQTKTWRRPKKAFIPKNKNPKTICPLCGGNKKASSKICRDCADGKKKETFASEMKERRDAKRENNPKSLVINLCVCGEVISSQASQCTKCAHVKQQRIEWPTVDDLVTRLRDNKESYTSVAKSLGVSDNSVRKYLRKHNVDPKTFQPLDKETDDK